MNAAGIESGEAVGQPAVSAVGAAVLGGGGGYLNAAHGPNATPPWTIRPIGITSAEAVGRPRLAWRDRAATVREAEEAMLVCGYADEIEFEMVS